MVDAKKPRLLPRSSQEDMPLKLAYYCLREVAGVLTVSPGTMGRLYVRNSPRPDGDPAEPSFEDSVYPVKNRSQLTHA